MEPKVIRTLDFKGLSISIEFNKGDMKPYSSDFVDKDEAEWRGWEMYADYGFINDSIGNDREQMDVFIGPEPESDEAFILVLMKERDQGGKEYEIQADLEMDEWKFLLGFKDYEQACDFCLRQYSWRADPSTVIRSSIQDIKDLALLSSTKAKKELLLLKEEEQPVLVMPMEEHEQPTLVIPTSD